MCQVQNVQEGKSNKSMKKKLKAKSKTFRRRKEKFVEWAKKVV